MYYTISELSKKIDISPHTLRFYAKEGLMPFVERNQNGIRIFKDDDLELLFMIKCLKKSGMSIKEIKEFMNCVCKVMKQLINGLICLENSKKKL